MRPASGAGARDYHFRPCLQKTSSDCQVSVPGEHGSFGLLAVCHGTVSPHPVTVVFVRRQTFGILPPPPAESRASTLDTKRWNEQVARRRSQGHLEMLAASTLRSDHHLTDAPPDYTRSRSMSDGAVMTQLAMHDHMTIFDPVSGLTFVSMQGEDDEVANMIHDFNSTIPSLKGTR
ncbi:uncharacterized protein LOC112557471 [Pomacea canaliculata]|uniref:uncharacterized protein LOC112557471 n=1 Tax=Pomacea canaliculata TaxID=400727 RepID=UPI000D732670|nr:uncharacterized protein LOC112557471 [Pomacea canaliculata]XP_025083136.1 uncharacterized protein LOC112557471 [Pomacea canaliculata]